MYSDGPMAFVAMDAQFRTSIECRELGVPFVPCDLFASQDDANGTGGTDGDDDSVQWVEVPNCRSRSNFVGLDQPTKQSTQTGL
jgi:hypothetical protein